MSFVHLEHSQLARRRRDLWSRAVGWGPHHLIVLFLIAGLVVASAQLVGPPRSGTQLGLVEYQSIRLGSLMASVMHRFRGKERGPAFSGRGATRCVSYQMAGSSSAVICFDPRSGRVVSKERTYSP